MKSANPQTKRLKQITEFLFGKSAARLDFESIRSRWEESAPLLRKKKRGIGLYVHVPFCERVCYFCNCYSRCGREQELRDYVELLGGEIKKFAPIFAGIDFDSLYLGGGTPSALPEDCLDRLLGAIYKNFSLKKAHSSFEGSPGTLSESKLRILERFHFKRLTIGVQSFDRKALKINNRVFASAAQIEKLVSGCKQRSISTNLELIYGLNGQSRGSFLKDVERIVKIRPNQVHLYGFTCDPTTIIWHAEKNRRLPEESWRTIGAEMLAEANYKRFPRGGYADRFNAINAQLYNSMVHNAAVLGLGEGALSSIDKDFKYGSIMEKGAIVYRKLLKKCIKRIEVFN